MERYIDIISEASSKTLLIVDDDEVNRNILANLFSDEYSTEEAENGRIGLNKILAVPHRYCAILLDAGDGRTGSAAALKAGRTFGQNTSISYHGRNQR